MNASAVDGPSELATAAGSEALSEVLSFCRPRSRLLCTCLGLGLG